MQKNHIGGIHIAKKIALCIFLVSATLSAVPKSTFGATSSVFQVIQKKVTISMKNATLETILAEINRQTGLDYGFQSNGSVDKNRRFTLEVTDITVEEALNTLLKDSPYDYVLEKNRIVIVIREKKPVQLIAVTGRVVDEKGNPIPGATVLIQGTTQGVATDADGRYTINTRPEDALRISFIGYKTEVVPLKGKTKLNVRLNPTAENIEEVTVVAFGEQKKESVVSAITTVDARTLKSSSSDLTSQFAGKIAGIVGWQTGGIPGALTEEEMNTKFYIRGITSFQSKANIDPLILIDGVESSKLDLSRMTPEDIETFSVMKDASATAMYGARGANGVILITTKKGQEGSVYTSVRYEAVLSMPTREIEVVDPINYMKMYNQALLARNPDATPQYSVERIERTGSPSYPSWVYPANDWYDIMFHDYSINHRAGLNIRGGSRLVQYYTSVNYVRDEGMLKTDRLNQFKCNIENSTFSFRTNLNIDLSAGIRLNINTSANLDKYRGPYADVSQAYYLAFNASPVDFAPTYPADESSNWPHLRFGAVDQNTTNPYLILHQGYKDRRRYSAVARAEYIHNLSTLLKGLELRASVSMNQTGYYANAYKTVPYMYALKDYDFETGVHQLNALNSSEASRTLTKDTDGQHTNSSQSTQMSYEVRGLHVAAWGEHQTSLTVVFNAQETTYSQTASVLDGIPNRNMGVSMRGTYGWRDKYFAEASFGYNGSERFAKDHQFGFFPALGAAWIASKERFLADHTAHWLSFLKFRFSWGKVGNDGVIKTPRFTHLPLLDNDSALDPAPSGNNISRPYVASYPNEKLTWEIAEQSNIGIETKFFGGIVELNADIYQEIRHNILDYRYTMPSTTGLEKPQIGNVGKARSRGIDLSGKIQHAFTPDLWMILNGTFTYSKATYREIEEATSKPEWQRREGHELSQQIGYIAEGLFRDQAEINNSPTQGGDIMPGDIRYRDINEDGVIDVNDATYIGFPTTPRVIYGFSGFFNFKNIEFSFAFQGSGKRAFFMNPQNISPFVDNRAMLKAIYDDHWSADNMKEHPFWPRLSTQSITAHNPQEAWTGSEERRSTYFMRECSFLRCTSIELAYNLPREFLQRLRMQTVKFYARVNNPFLITNFKVWDVELGDNGFNYPIQRTWSIGLNLSF
ncbi:MULTISPECIES: TonB-dependent receptor [Butyricimonas]|jgi:TonB-linked SusC/RagA family outer membrane protein|uniref:TonB-dependent receptor n=1 Tax=Butyricimonas TaxID=574697 RepID=UPI000E433D6A|nr:MULTISPECIES: TonB-dependent receptor [Butyricimonas]MBO4960109.1 TonB-dependent receptor [Butyricimonas sp.]MCI7294146.1 TonB-dependent receptor [Butyricimonas virosa]MDY6219651.1 TonB-dependent receptor [Butyricimonas virosa]RGL82831.1 SusC/RagA family TonB-linked outer membrane protein [Butyricimonas virosa]